MCSGNFLKKIDISLILKYIYDSKVKKCNLELDIFIILMIYQSHWSYQSPKIITKLNW